VRDLFQLKADTVERLRAAYFDGIRRDRGRDAWRLQPPEDWSPPAWFRAAA
jgi:hypothetical protein